MGERAGYIIVSPFGWTGEKNDVAVSPVYRTQWYLGGDEVESAQKLMMGFAEFLLADRYGTSTNPPKVGSGMTPFRPDLGFERLLPNFIAYLDSISKSQLNSMEDSYNCDINEHGLMMLVVEQWNLWHWDYAADPEAGVKSRRLVSIQFTADKPLPEAAYTEIVGHREGILVPQQLSFGRGQPVDTIRPPEPVEQGPRLDEAMLVRILTRVDLVLGLISKEKQRKTKKAKKPVKKAAPKKTAKKTAKRQGMERDSRPKE